MLNSRASIEKEANIDSKSLLIPLKKSDNTTRENKLGLKESMISQT